jgi:hypothetical protein
MLVAYKLHAHGTILQGQLSVHALGPGCMQEKDVTFRSPPVACSPRIACFTALLWVWMLCVVGCCVFRCVVGCCIFRMVASIDRSLVSLLGHQVWADTVGVVYSFCLSIDH